MGKGFCFVGRQKRLTVEGDHFYVDLVFYNRLLRCFVLVDLKLGKASAKIVTCDLSFEYVKVNAEYTT